jgi:hypothetical protein
MAKKTESADATVVSALHAAIPTLVDGAARDNRVASVARTDLSSRLADSDLRQLADTDADLNRSIATASAAITAQEEAAARWQKDLAAVSKVWTASLTDLAKLDTSGN